MIGDKLKDEEGRLAALRRYDLPDTDDRALDQIVELVRLTLQAPIAVLSLVDRDRITYRSTAGATFARDDRRASFADQAISTYVPMIVTDAIRDDRFMRSPEVIESPHVRSYLGTPLTTPDGYNIGVLAAMDTIPRYFDATQKQILKSLAQITMDQLELRQVAKLDAMTGALTRRGFLAELERDFARSRRYNRPSALVIFDIDHFRAINDSFGHPAGDDVLTAVARQCTEAIRQSDTFGRVGGEEFAILMPETIAAEAGQAAERIRQRLEALDILGGGRRIPVTASFGVAPLTDAIESAEQWMVEADVALYEAKRDGRNRTVVARPRRIADPAAPGPSMHRPTLRVH